MSRPLVTLAFAQSLDGRIALPGTRTLLSSRAGLEMAHRCRAEHDAVLVGSSTVKIDDPQLNVRHVKGRDPRRIVLASSLDIPTSARLFAPGSDLLVIGAVGAPRTSVEALQTAGAQVRLVQAEPSGRVALDAALEAILHWGVRRLLVEGGASVLSSFLQQRLADRVVVEIVPKFLGGSGVACASNLVVNRVEDCPGLTELSVDNMGASIVLRGKLERQSAHPQSATFGMPAQPRVVA